jgi:flavin reductase (DIM6/NTAB) family NADH-FMN oxidoreductase RutF
MIKIDPSNLEWREAHELLVGAIVPRPIAFVATVGKDGVLNVAPFSFFSGVCCKPALVGVGIEGRRDGRRKDTIINIESSKEYVIAVVTEALAEAMNQASTDYASDVDEFKEAGLTPAKADIVKAPMVAESPVNLECRVVQILEFGSAARRSNFVIGEVLRVHIKDDLYLNDAIQMSKLKAIGRLGGQLYCRTTDLFEMERPFILQ